MRPPKPPARAEARVPFWRYVRLFRKDILSAQPDRLYRAWMAEFRTPFFRSFLINDPGLVELVLRKRPGDFPKSTRVTEGLRPLLGGSIFIANGDSWARQRQLIAPAFGAAGADPLPGIEAACQAALDRLEPGEVDVERWTSHLAADVIFRTLFSRPIDNEQAARTYVAFKAYQAAQPIMNIAALLPLPRWIPRGHRPIARRASRELRRMLEDLILERAKEISAGTAPDDLATRLMTARCPDTGTGFTSREIVDQIATFFLAGHETSAAALSWSMYLLATHPDAQSRVFDEGRRLRPNPVRQDLARLGFTRDVIRETMRLYPPVPMMVREARNPATFRNRSVPSGAQVVLSPWHLHRHARIWDDPDGFDPSRWASAEGRAAARVAYIPFSAGPRVCPGAGFAMAEVELVLARLLARWRMVPGKGAPPVPVAHLTVRSRNGIALTLIPR